MESRPMSGRVIAVCCNPEPDLPKPVVDAVHLIENWGVEGDYHAGSLVRHRYLAKKDPTRPNMRQVLLMDAAVFAELAQNDIHIGPQAIFKAGIMAQILQGGWVRAGDLVKVLSPADLTL